MAQYNGISFNIKGLVRPCLANGRKALFHKWFTESKVVPPSSLRGGHSGGQLSTLLGLVEWEDGTVHAIPTWEIKFLDTPFQMDEFEACYYREDHKEELS